MKSKVFRAGLLPYTIDTDGTIRFMFMRPSDGRFGGPQFQIAKGKIEEGEEELEAALREAEEELGLLYDNLRSVDYLGHYLGRTAMFVGEVLDVGRFKEPHFETAETAWMSVPEYQRVGRALHVPILQDALQAIYLTVK